MRRGPGGGKSAILPEWEGQPEAGQGLAEGFLEWTEWLTPGVGTTLSGIALRADVRSPHQHIQIGESPEFGHIFRLDGRIMSTEADAFIQHELMVHPMAVAHGAPRSALVLGGGDGGSARELLRLPGIARVSVAELDGEVVALSRRWLGGIHQGAFDDARLQLHIGDALAFLHAAAQAGDTFDLMVFDLTEADDGGPAVPLFAAGGLAAARRCLAPGGALSIHLGPLFHRPRTARALMDRLRMHFARVAVLSVAIPAYGAVWGIAFASDSLDVSHPDPVAMERVWQAWKLDGALRCYRPALHPALFMLPTHLQGIVDGTPVTARYSRSIG